MDYKKEFKAARAANDWTKVDELWQQLCKEAEIEETQSGNGEAGKVAAEQLNRINTNGIPGGIKL